jgi:hypothetical protein
MGANPQSQLQTDIPDNTICALTELLGDSVALVDDEVLVEDLEDLATLEIRHDCFFPLLSLNELGFRV